MIPSIQKQIKQSWQLLKNGGWHPMLAVYVVFLLGSIAILTPLTTLSVQGIVSLSGQEALSDTDIAHFLLSPLGAVTGIALATLTLTFALLGYAALLIPAHAIQNDERSSLTKTFTQLAKHTPVLLRLSRRIITRYLILALPFLAVIGATYWFLLSENDINYYLAEHPPEFIGAVAIAAITLLLFGISWIKITVSWFFSIPLILFSQKSSHEAKTLSEQHSLGHKKAITTGLALWLFGSPLLSFLLTLPIVLLGSWLIPQLAHRLPMLALALGISMLLNAIISFSVGFISLSLLAHYNIRLFKELGLDASCSGACADQLSTHHHIFQVSSRDWKVISAAVLAVLCMGGVSFYMIQKLPLKDDTLVIAHRGASKMAPENTLAAIKKAVELKADWVEIDVQETADGKVIVYHDSDFKRLGNNPTNTWNIQSSELNKVDIGSWFSPKFSTENPPSLKEVLQVCKGKSGLIIELKYYGHDQNLEQKVVDLVEAAGMEDHVMIMSLSYKGVQKIRKIRPHWPIGLLSTVALGDITKLDVDFLGLNSRAATKSLIKKAHKLGIKVFVWTVDDPIDMSTMASRGADGLITNVPDVALDILQQRKKLNHAERLLLELAHIFGKRPPITLQ